MVPDVVLAACNDPTLAAYVLRIVYSSGSVTVTVGSSATMSVTSNGDFNLPVERYVVPLAPGPRRPRRPPQPAAVRPWQPKLVLREAVASWTVSLRAFAGR